MDSKQDIVDSINGKRAEIIEQVTNPIDRPDAIKRLISLLVSFREQRFVDHFCIKISQKDLSSIDFDLVEKNLEAVISPALKTHDHFKVDAKFNIIEKGKSPSTSIEARSKFKEMSKHDVYVIAITNPSYAMWFNEKEESNIVFITPADLKKYEEKRDISDIHQVMEEYRCHLLHHKNVSKFFVDKFTLGKLNEKKFVSNNIFRNKPEHDLRIDLRDFLASKIDRTFNFSIENQTDSRKRLDINTEDNDGNYYFFEVKWLGRSVSDDGTKIGNGFTAASIVDGYKQSLKYIKELIEMSRSVKMGGFVVFDGRQDKSDFSDSYHDRHIGDDLKPFKSMFHPYDKLQFDNSTPK